VKNILACSLVALTLGACSEAPQKAEAPPGAMESFADRQEKIEAKGENAGLKAARAREVGREADARQKVQAAEGMDRFERSERALQANVADNGG
jgi:cell fate (sporulation/competence/biofilm development) regulator YlbF (YheA/YmcA/DUF963 family)